MLTVSVTISDFVGQIEKPPKMAIFDTSGGGWGGYNDVRIQKIFVPTSSWTKCHLMSFDPF